MNKNRLGGNLGKLSDVAKMVVTRATPTVAPDQYLELSKIYTTTQVRKTFKNLKELSESIREHGIIEPLVVHAEPDGRHRLIVGERRYRAAPMADETKVPVVIKRGLTEEQIRGLQVAENNERDDLTPYEKVMGVIEDVEKFGVKGAMKIWNIKSEGWISKRVAVKRYLPVTLSILKDELSGDLEVLHAINMIEQLDAGAAQEMRAQLERGESLNRETVRSKLAMMELQKQEAASRLNSAPPAQAVLSAASSDGATSGGPREAADTPSAGEIGTGVSQQSESGQAPQKASVSKLPITPRAKPAPDAAAAAARESTLKGERLYEQRLELFEYGRDNEDSFNNLQALMSDLGHTPDQGEWVMWIGFLDMVLPMLDRLGDARSKAYLKRLLAELKGASPSNLWHRMHPGADLNDGSKEGERVPRMPDGWKF